MATINVATISGVHYILVSIIGLVGIVIMLEFRLRLLELTEAMSSTCRDRL